MLETPSITEGRTRPLTPIMALVLLIGTFTAAAVHFAEGIYLGRHYPWNTFLFRPEDHFMDFFNDYRRAVDYGVDGSHILDYSPFAHLTMKVSTILPANVAFAVFLGVFCVSFAGCIWTFFCRREDDPFLKAWYMVVLSAFSYAFLIAFDRANMEMIVFVLLFGYVWAYSVRRYGIAAVLLGAAIALKMYPVVFLVLPLTDRRVRDAVWSVGWAAGLTVVGVAVLAVLTPIGPLTVVKDWVSWLALGHGPFVLPPFELVTHRHSLYAVVYTTWFLVAGADPPSWVSSIYLAAAALGFLAIAAWLIVRSRPSAGTPMPLWCRVGVLALCQLLLPFMSGDYALLQLYLPLMLLAATGWSRPIDLAAAMVLVLALVPIDFIVLAADTTISVFVHPALLMLALALMLWGSRAAATLGVARPEFEQVADAR